MKEGGEGSLSPLRNARGHTPFTYNPTSVGLLPRSEKQHQRRICIIHPCSCGTAHVLLTKTALLNSCRFCLQLPHPNHGRRRRRDNEGHGPKQSCSTSSIRATHRSSRRLPGVAETIRHDLQKGMCRLSRWRSTCLFRSGTRKRQP